MSVWLVTVIMMSAVRRLGAWHASEYHVTPQVPLLQHVDDIQHVAEVSGAGAHRGPRWYDYDSSTEHNSDSDVQKKSDTGSSGSIGTDSKTDKRSSAGSSIETHENRLATRAYRECTPCPLDMIRKHTNVGIKWICAAYQRARRTFKSECMMRFRNCQDGTMFIKISDHRCREDPFHGRHWFYIYNV